MIQKCPKCKVTLWYDCLTEENYADDDEHYIATWECHCSTCQRTFTVVETYSFKEATISEIQ